MLQQSVEERWDTVNWQMLHPLRQHGLHDTLPAAALASHLLSVVDIVQRAHHLDEALNVTVEVNAFSQCPALHCSAHSGNVNIVRYFLSLGLPVDTVTAKKNTALHIAASKGNLEVVRCLVEAHADVNLKDNFGYTPLHWASMKGHEQVVRLLTNVSSK